MTNQEFYEFQTNVEGTAETFANQPDGSTIVTCSDGAKILVNPDGSSQVMREEAR